MLLKKSKLEGNEVPRVFRYCMLARGIWALYCIPSTSEEARFEWASVFPKEEFEIHLEVLEGDDEFDVLQFSYIGSYRYLILVKGNGAFIPRFYLIKNGKEYGIQSEPAKEFLGRLPYWALFKSYLEYYTKN
jgi:hypothetical protein